METKERDNTIKREQPGRFSPTFSIWWKSLSYYPALIIIIIVFLVDSEAYRGWHIPKEYGIIWLVSLGWLLWWFRNQLKERPVSKPLVHFSIIEILLLVRLAWLVLSHPELLSNSTGLALPIVSALTGWVLLIRQENAKKKHVWRILRVLWLAGIVESLIALWQYFTTNTEHVQSVKTFMIGSIGSANGFGIFIALAIMAALADGWLHKANKRFMLVTVSATLLMFITIITNGSRGAFISLLVGVSLIWIMINHKQAFTIWKSFRLKRFMVYGSLGLMVFTAIVYSLYRHNPASVKGRFMIWSVSMPMLTQHSLTGIGFGRYSVDYLTYQARYFSNNSHKQDAWRAANIKQAHNEYLQAFYESGIPGGILFLIIWLVAIGFLWRKIKSKLESWFEIMILGLLCVVMVHSLVDAPLHVLPVSLIVYGLLGFVPVPSKWRWSVKLPKWSAFFSITGVFLTVTAWIFIQYPGYRSWQRGVRAAHQTNWSQAISYYREALEILPDQGELQFHLGAAFIQDGMYSAGLYHLNQARETFNDRNIYLSMSLGYLKLGQYKQASQYARTAQRMFPDQLAPVLLLAEIYHRQGEETRAKKELQRCIYQKTHIKSDKTKLIANDARRLWYLWYGEK